MERAFPLVGTFRGGRTFCTLPIMATTASSHRSQVFSAYRRLYRARSFLFKGDDRAMRESRIAARAEFLKHNGDSRIVTEPAHFTGLLGMVDEAVDMLRHGIVRGNLNPKTGHYEVKLKKEHVGNHTVASGQPPLVQPVTADTVRQFEKHNQQTNDDIVIETTKAKDVGSVRKG